MSSLAGTAESVKHTLEGATPTNRNEILGEMVSRGMTQAQIREMITGLVVRDESLMTLAVNYHVTTARESAEEVNQDRSIKALFQKALGVAAKYSKYSLLFLGLAALAIFGSRWMVMAAAFVTLAAAYAKARGSQSLVKDPLPLIACAAFAFFAGRFLVTLSALSVPFLWYARDAHVENLKVEERKKEVETEIAQKVAEELGESSESSEVTASSEETGNASDSDEPGSPHTETWGEMGSRWLGGAKELASSTGSAAYDMATHVASQVATTTNNIWNGTATS